MEEVAAFHGAPGSRHQCLLPLPEGAHRRRWLPWVSPWRAWRSVAPSSAPRSRLPTSRPGGPGTFPNIPISSQYHPNIIPISSNIPNIPNILPPSKLLQASRPSTPQVHSFSSENLNTSQFFACGAAVSVTWAKTLSAASSMAAPSKAFDFSGFVMTRVWDSLGRCQYKTDHYLANRSCVAEHMFKPNRFGISNLFGNVWSLLLNVVNIVS